MTNSVNKASTVIAYGVGVLGLVSIAAIALPGPLYGWNVLSLKNAFTLITWGAFLSMAAVGTGLLALILVWRMKSGPRAAGSASLGLVAGAGGLAMLFTLMAQARDNPLHDISTDLDDIPQFQILSPRTYKPGGPFAPSAAPHPDWREKHQLLYADMKAIDTPMPVEEALQQVVKSATALSWDIAHQAVDENGIGRLEATDTSKWFRFKDDVVVRIRPTANGSTIDARSVSRVGRSDLGANAKRLRRFFQELSGE